MKIMIVTEKKSIAASIEAFLERVRPENEYFFDFVKPVLPMDSEALHLSEENGIILEDGKRTDLQYLQIEGIQLPEKQYVEAVSCPNGYKNSVYLKDVDKVIGVFTSDDCSILSFAKYLQVNDLRMEEAGWYSILSFDARELCKTFAEDPDEFSHVFSREKKVIEKYAAE